MILSSLENDWQSVSDQHKYTGITAQEFLKHAFSLSGEEWDDLKDRIDQAAVHPSRPARPSAIPWLVDGQTGREVFESEVCLGCLLTRTDSDCMPYNFA